VLTLTMVAAAAVVGSGGHLGTGGPAEAVTWAIDLPPVQVAVAVVALATFITALAWLHRVVGNVPPLTGRTPLLSPVQVAVLCCVPGFHLVVPVLTIEDLTVRLRLPGQADVRRLAWAWAAVAVLAQGLAGMAIAGPVTALPAAIPAAALLAGSVATLLLLLLVRRVEDRASRLAVLLRLGDAGPASRWPVFPESEPDEAAPLELPAGDVALPLALGEAREAGPLPPMTTPFAPPPAPAAVTPTAAAVAQTAAAVMPEPSSPAPSAPPPAPAAVTPTAAAVAPTAAAVMPEPSSPAPFAPPPAPAAVTPASTSVAATPELAPTAPATASATPLAKAKASASRTPTSIKRNLPVPRARPPAKGARP
jgi:hypothetical protein